MAAIKPFQISVPDSQLETLRKKLELANFPDELDEANWDLGTPLADIKRLAGYWRDKFDWRETERRLNEQIPQFTTNVDVAGFDPLNIHFVHQKSKVSGAIPLLFIHGWPGSFLEVTKLLPLLTKGSESQPAFHVVAPSLPNFGFSEGVKKRGFGIAQYAESLHAVMTALGYEQYAIQGGDWGAVIARVMAKLYPKHVKAVHTNMVFIAPPYPWKNPLDRAKLAVTWNYMTQGNGYLAQQGSRPQTIGYSLHDSPVGLLAWIYEKLHAWTDSYPWTDDEVLTWVSIYAFSRAGPAASARIYYEFNHAPSGPGNVSRAEAVSCYSPDVKFAIAQFPREIITLPMFWCRSIGNVVRETEFEKGGHFAAWEVPEDLAADIREFLGKEGQAYRAISGADGY
ncbi:epoxide hydrolase [Arthroderma uncinatum]|uniref:epoxide hydrolase n=1 Tax=Arthroderma uncinatum TaxID=74035 RepID=UPI00144AF69C|nr:epoxide hydrolase [Arthroderma uncinatum]KAF3483082.1 epoxide hydrolase [Arthroderma uncinatum]